MTQKFFSSSYMLQNLIIICIRFVSKTYFTTSVACTLFCNTNL